ncbi:MAG: sugar transferase [Oscillospiraceae bacterium]
MLLMPYEKLPKVMQNVETRDYYDELQKKIGYLFVKRLLDIIFSLIVIIFLFPLMLLIGLIIKLQTGDNPIYKQIRVKQYMNKFEIIKFRTMKYSDNDVLLTLKDDERVTKIGRVLRKYRLDELLQLFNILKGDMSFVGSRPEVPQYVDYYTKNMLATLLLPVGLTSRASIEFKDENKLLSPLNYKETYLNIILPKKMQLNISYLKKISILEDIKIIFKTLLEMLN